MIREEGDGEGDRRGTGRREVTNGEGRRREMETGLLEINSTGGVKEKRRRQEERRG